MLIILVLYSASAIHSQKVQLTGVTALGAVNLNFIFIYIYSKSLFRWEYNIRMDLN